MAATGRTPTLQDVAAEAGVSTATVSRFVNNPAVVAEETGRRIRQAIERVGYIPNAAAGELASQRSRMVAVLIPHLENSMLSETIERMVREMTASGNTVLLGVTDAQDSQVLSLVRAALSRRVDAIVATGPATPELRALVERSRALFIQVWDLPEDPVGLAIGFSHEDAGREIARFCRARGYRQPHLAVAEGSRAVARRNGFVAEWLASGGAQPTESTVDVPSRFGHARRVFAGLRRLDRQPDVVICSSDFLAQGIIVEAHAAGLRVPEDLAVIGFGNSSVAEAMRPPITTVEIDGARIAREVMAAIAQHQQRQPFASRRIDVGFRLIARESV